VPGFTVHWFIVIIKGDKNKPCINLIKHRLCLIGSIRQYSGAGGVFEKCWKFSVREAAPRPAVLPAKEPSHEYAFTVDLRRRSWIIPIWLVPKLKLGNVE
jgi:hypothetical protein